MNESPPYPPRPPWVRQLRRAAWFSAVMGVVLWSLWLLFTKLRAEVAADPHAREMLADGGFFVSLWVIGESIGRSLTQIPAHGYLLAGLSALVAYVALAWYDRIALIHLNRVKGITWPYIATCSFVTYALGHNLGASVLSGGLVRLRAYSAKGLSAAEVAVLVALCTYTFVFGTVMLTGFVFVIEPQIVAPLAELNPYLALPEWLIQLVGALLLVLCLLYVIGSWQGFKPLRVRKFEIFYPRLAVVARQLLAAPLEIVAAAGIIYFALPAEGNPGFMIVLGAFLLSFSAGLVSQTPGGIGVMEAVFLAIISSVSPSAVMAALVVWRLMYLIVPLIISLPIVIAFERAQLDTPPSS